MTTWDRTDPSSPLYDPYAWTGNTATDIQNHYPGMTQLMNIPEIRDLLTRAARERWTPEKLQAAYYGTQYYASHNQQQAKWPTLSNAERQTERLQIASNMQEFLREQLGDAEYQKRYGNENSARFWESHKNLIEQVASGKMPFEIWQHEAATALSNTPGTQAFADKIQRQEELAKRLKRPQEIGEQLFMSAHGDYFLPYDKASAVKWADDIVNGRSSFGEFQDFMRQQAAALFPTYKDAIMNGVLPGQLFAPALNTLAKELETSTDAVKNNSKLWNEIAAQAAGSKTPFTASDWIHYARSLPDWQRTQNARELTSSFETELLKRFGAIGG